MSRFLYVNKSCNKMKITLLYSNTNTNVADTNHRTLRFYAHYNDQRKICFDHITTYIGNQSKT